MEENLKAFGFELSSEDMSALDGLDRGEKGRVGPHAKSGGERRLPISSVSD
jgi:diketogulonate reductase-like aldo/keto reductase